jgi:hypothetical protein
LKDILLKNVKICRNLLYIYSRVLDLIKGTKMLSYFEELILLVFHTKFHPPFSLDTCHPCEHILFSLILHAFQFVSSGLILCLSVLFFSLYIRRYRKKLLSPCSFFFGLYVSVCCSGLNCHLQLSPKCILLLISINFSQHSLLYHPLWFNMTISAFCLPSLFTISLLS